VVLTWTVMSVISTAEYSKDRTVLSISSTSCFPSVSLNPFTYASPLNTFLVHQHSIFFLSLLLAFCCFLISCSFIILLLFSVVLQLSYFIPPVHRPLPLLIACTMFRIWVFIFIFVTLTFLSCLFWCLASLWQQKPDTWGSLLPRVLHGTITIGIQEGWWWWSLYVVF